jgi:DnaJ-class molecular chaperone
MTPLAIAEMSRLAAAFDDADRASDVRLMVELEAEMLRLEVRGAVVGEACPTCSGSGRERWSQWGGNDPGVVDRGPCSECDGTGKVLP